MQGKGKKQGPFERMARIPRNQLLDQLFDLFKKQPLWSIRPLREKVQQPEVYLKEVLQDIAFLHKSGEHNGLWELQDFVKDSSVRNGILPVCSNLSDKLFIDESRRYSDGHPWRHQNGRRRLRR